MPRVKNPEHLFEGVETVFLDAVGTLFGLKESPGVIYARVAARHGIEAEADRLAKAFLGVWRGMELPDYSSVAWELGREVLESSSTGPDLPVLRADRERVDRNWWAQIVRACFAAAGVGAIEDDRFDAFYDELFALYGTTDPWKIYDDTIPALEAMREEGRRLVVVSNFDARLVKVMEALQLSELVDVILYSSALAACKPQPEAFHRALGLAGAEAQTTLHVGDEPEIDGRGAEGVGLRFFHVDRPERDLSDLAN